MTDRHRIYSSLLALGACVLLTRGSVMIHQGALTILAGWVAAALLLEVAVDAVTLGWSLRWWATGSERHASFALRAGATAALLHAVRVGIFAVGRVGPWIDFDVRPEHRRLHAERWTWPEVYFASVMAALGVAAVVWIRRRRRRRGGAP